MSRLSDALDSGRFVVTGEVGPPLGTDTGAMERAAAIMAPVCTAINVTDNQGATLHMSSMAAGNGWRCSPTSWPPRPWASRTSSS